MGPETKLLHSLVVGHAPSQLGQLHAGSGDDQRQGQFCALNEVEDLFKGLFAFLDAAVVYAVEYDVPRYVQVIQIVDAVAGHHVFRILKDLGVKQSLVMIA